MSRRKGSSRSNCPCRRRPRSDKRRRGQHMHTAPPARDRSKACDGPKPLWKDRKHTAGADTMNTRICEAMTCSGFQQDVSPAVCMRKRRVNRVRQEMNGSHIAAAARIHGHANRRNVPPGRETASDCPAMTGRVNTQTAEHRDKPAAKQLIQKNILLLPLPIPEY